LNNSKSITFHEEQRFRQGWVLILILVAVLAPIAILTSELINGRLDKIDFTLAIIAVVAVELPIFLLVYYSKLETMVTAEGLGYRWRPLQTKYRMIFKDEVLDIGIRKSPAFNYGVHWIPGYGWVHNVRGRMGMQMKLKSGKKIYVGSQRINELKAALEKLLNKRIAEFRNEL
jgi:hypothetical protein